nr:hypothetical 10K protein - foxtail mosaic virus [Foxtail mosaic virus]
MSWRGKPVPFSSNNPLSGKPRSSARLKRNRRKFTLRCCMVRAGRANPTHCRNLCGTTLTHRLRSSCRLTSSGPTGRKNCPPTTKTHL